jgi:hypothetical protein
VPKFNQSADVSTPTVSLAATNSTTVTLAGQNANSHVHSANKIDVSDETDDFDSDLSDKSDPENIVLFDGSNISTIIDESAPAASLPAVGGGDLLPISCETSKIAMMTPAVHFTQANGERTLPPEALKKLRTLGLSVQTGRTAHEILLNTGSMLVAPSKDETVRTNFGDVRIKAGAVALVIGLENGVAVYDMHDSHRGDVSVSTCGQRFRLNPGTHVTLANNNISTFGHINPLRCIGHRDMKTTLLEDGMQCLSSEFSIVSALHGLRLFNQLRASNKSSDARIVDKTLKTAAVLLNLRSRAGQYQRASKDRT